MKLVAASHLDHFLTSAHVEFILTRFADRKAFFIETFELPSDLPGLPLGIHGPIVGDPPVPEEEVTYEVRGTRAGPSRLCSRAPRTTQTITVIAGPNAEHACVLYTAYGGPAALREPWDPSLTPEEKAQSVAFWQEHALSR